MSAITRTFRHTLLRRRGAADAETARPPEPPPPEPAPVDIAPNDPLLAYFQGVTGPVDIDTLELDSPALRELKAAGVKLAVPLVSQGELIGVLNLGPRLSEQDYSSDDRKLLDSLAAQAAPALRVGQLVREQEAEAATPAVRAGARGRPPDPAALPAQGAAGSAGMAGGGPLSPGS
jgi:GAF domain